MDNHTHTQGHDHGHTHDTESHPYWQAALSAVMLVAGLSVGYLTPWWDDHSYLAAVYYIIAFLPVGLPVMGEAWEGIRHGDLASEFMLMSVASIGALAIGEYPEAVAVMLLYAIGESLQDRAVDRARDNIKALMAFRPDMARRVSATGRTEVSPEQIQPGDIIEVRPGERVPLDGTLLAPENGAEGAPFDTAALTGESVPRTIDTGAEVLAGMIATDTVVHLQVTRCVGESAMARVLHMVEDAAEKKAPTELFIHRFAHVYTPVVIALAALTVAVPWIGSLMSGSAYDLGEWLRRALVFLVISCPCALVISVPLSYFAGIGCASRRGILFKGGNYIDAVTHLDTVVFDKTGTLTTGQFGVQQVVGLSHDQLRQVAAMELTSSHPIARAICAYCPVEQPADAQNIAGYGLQSAHWAVGTLRLLERCGIDYPQELGSIPDTIVACAYDGTYVGYILLADTIKADSLQAIARLDTQTVILSGDKQPLVEQVGRRLGVSHAQGDLLPQDKLAYISHLKEQGHRVAFVGDGINDAPALALSDVGIAMGAMGADMAIETADIIIQTDQPSKVAEAIGIGRATRRIVIQNIALAIGIKVAVMVLGVLGIANLWEAVFADTGVALIAVLNATRLMMAKRRGQRGC